MNEDRERMYRAMVAYTDEGLSLEESARRFDVSPHALRERMRQQGWPVRTWRETGKRTHGDTRNIPASAVAESIAGTPTWRLAHRYGVSVYTMQRWLRKNGAGSRDRFLTRHAIAQSEKARERVEGMLAMRAQGLTYGQIAIRTGYSRGYVSASLARYQRGEYRWQKTTTTREEA